MQKEQGFILCHFTSNDLKGKFSRPPSVLHLSCFLKGNNHSSYIPATECSFKFWMAKAARMCQLSCISVCIPLLAPESLTGCLGEEMAHRSSQLCPFQRADGALVRSSTANSCIVSSMRKIILGSKGACARFCSQ